MCRKDCGLNIRKCAEAQGGRKELKDRIKKLNAAATKDGQPDPSLIRLYECYQAVSLSVCMCDWAMLMISGRGMIRQGKSSERQSEVVIETLMMLWGGWDTEESNPKSTRRNDS
jgi:hypothetical protein